MRRNGCFTFLIALFIICGILTLIAFLFGGDSLSTNNAESTSSNNSEIKALIDVNKFARITSEELINLMGDPEEIEDMNYKSPNGNTYPTKTYYYNENKYQFLVIDNSVVRMNIFSEKYNDKDGRSFEFKDEESIFALFSIKTSKNIEKIKDTNYALRYHLVSDKIAEVWVPLMDKQKGIFDEIKITYNLNYF